MFAALFNTVMGLAMAASIAGGVALFWIARQDDSRPGRIVGILFPTAAMTAALYLTVGHHWF